MFTILIWCFFGLITGFAAKVLHPGDDPVGIVPTTLIGVAGSFIGGMINFALSLGNAPYEPSGFIMSILGGVIFCAIWRFYKLKTSVDGPRFFISGKKVND